MTRIHICCLVNKFDVLHDNFYATSRKVEDSRPDQVNCFFFLIYLILPASPVSVMYTSLKQKWASEAEQ
jgi:hypothetical protein